MNCSKGYQYSKENNYEIVIQIDGDNAADPSSILDMINFSINEKLDMCLAERIMRPDNILRKFITKVLYINLSFLYNVKAKDSNVGIRIIDVSLLRKINLNLLKSLLIPNAFLSSYAYYNNYLVETYPVNMRDNIRNDRLDEQWGSGINIKSLYKLFKGAYKCFLEVNTIFKNLIKKTG